MELVRGSAALERRITHPVLTIGNFDGVHLGHRAILDTVIERARALGGESVLYTFDPHPRKVLSPEKGPRLLATMDQKIEILESVGLDVLIVEHFDLEFARTPPEVFVRDFIHRRIGPKEVYVGYDFHFGRDREGSMRLLTETGPQLGFSVTIISEVTVGDRDVNSTRIRDLLGRGDVEEASELLGRPFSIRGEVVEGMHHGREMGFPTANLAPGNEMIPMNGVYASRVRLLDGAGAAFRLPAVTNIGVRPTLGDGRALTIESHLIDFDGDLYGRHIEVEFGTRLRPEQKFESLPELESQIARDVEAARAWLASS